MCKGMISEEREINNARTLFDELERQNHLGIDSLDNLTELLIQLQEPGLLGNLVEFQGKRDERKELQSRVEGKLACC